MGINKSCCNLVLDKHSCHPIPKDPKFKPCDCHKPVQKPKPLPCFNMDKLPDIENIELLAHELCKVNQGFDKCPQYYTKQNYDDLVNTLSGAFFHLYCKVTSIAGCPWFLGLAYNGTDPILEALQDKRDLPGYYIASEPGIYESFLYADGDNVGESIEVLEEELLSGIVFLKPKIIYSDTFVGYEKLVVEISAIKNINISIEEIQEAIKNIDPDIKLLEDIEYNALLELIANKQLKKGQEYKIIDYTFTTAQENTDSAHHDFDIIVVADSEDTLNENARACKREGDEYYANNNLAAWELKYSVVNDVNKYTWADVTNGKGVIYWLKDEFNNEAGYDFKSALFSKSLYVNEPYYEEGVSIEECSNYYTFDYAVKKHGDLSLSGSFVNCRISFNKNLPYNKFLTDGNNISITGTYNYIHSSYNIIINDTKNYIDNSFDVYLDSSNTIVKDSNEINTKRHSLNNVIIQCRDIQLGFENNANYLENCLYFTTDSSVSSLKIYRWYYCTIGTDSENIISENISLEYSTIGLNNENVTFIGEGTFSNKVISPFTFNTSWQEPNYEFLFDSNIANEHEIVSKKHYETFID